MLNFFSFSNPSQTHRTLEQVFVLSSTSPEDFGGPAYLDDLISTGLGSHGNQFLLRAGNQKIYKMWVLAVDSACSWAIEDASAHLGLYLQRGRESSTTVLFSMHDVSDVGKEERGTYLATMMSIDSEACQPLVLSKEEQDLYHNFREADPSSHRPARMIFRKLAVFLCALVFILTPAAFLLASSHHSTSTPDLWMHWDTNGSEGLRNQLQFTSPHPDFQTWAKQNGKEDDSYFIRIDDQSMIPSHLIDDTERKYQKWFENRYPEMRAIRDTGAYLNASFHDHSSSYEIATDRFIHPAHCILVLRRYVTAKETGKHICPRDIEKKHIAHCLDSLDDFAFVDGERGTEPTYKESEVYTQPWLPNMCF